jgi:hypothetical protein
MCIYTYSYVCIYAYVGTKIVEKWDFNGASLDQGLLFYTYAVNNINYDTSVVIIDDIKGRFFLCIFVYM